MVLDSKESNSIPISVEADWGQLRGIARMQNIPSEA